MDAKTLIRSSLLGMTAVALTAQAAPRTYAEGQVWEYRTRPVDKGSLLKIQKITPAGADKVYHVSVIGVHFRRADIAGVLPHIPVSKATLDSSVTRQSSSQDPFPTPSDVEKGVETWRQDQGGVFSLPMSEIVEIIDTQTSEAKGKDR